MANKSNWKQRERNAAKFFGGRRTPPFHPDTRGDVMHDKLYVECKQRVKHASVTLWDDTNEKAKKEGKIPVVYLTVKNRPGGWLVIKDKDLKDVAREGV